MYKDLALLGKNYSLSPKRFHLLKRKYLGLYKAKLLEAYDLGYTNEVSVFSEEDFYRSYASEGINLTFLEGKVLLEPWVFHLEWLLSGKENEFYLLMRDLLEYRHACSSIDAVYDGIRMYKAKATKAFTWGITYTNMGIRGVSRLAQLNKYTYELLISEDEYFKEFSERSALSFGLEQLYYGRSRYIEDVSLDIDSVPIYGELTVEDLGEYLEDILLGGIELPSSLLKDFLSGHSSTHLGVYELYKLGKESFLAYISDTWEYLDSNNEKVIGFDNFHTYIVGKKEDDYSEEIPIGAYSVDYDTSKVLPLVNNLYGVTGDFVSLGSPLFSEEGYVYTGCPIPLYDGDEFSLYVDVEQVFGLGQSSLIFDLGMQLEFSERGSSQLTEEFGLVDFYVNSFKLQDEGIFIRTLKGYHSKENKDFAIKKASKLLGIG